MMSFMKNEYYLKYYVSLHEKTMSLMMYNADEKKSKHVRRISFILLHHINIFKPLLNHYQTTFNYYWTSIKY